MACKIKYTVHRVRFIEYVPQAIHCMVVEDCNEPCRLALSRADSSIEIWNFKENWYQETIIPGCNGTSVESLEWSRGRLFSGGLHAKITEWDLVSLHPKITVDSFGGAVWCLSANYEKTHLAVGCEDGRVRLFEITNHDLLYNKSLDKQEGRVLCLSWHPNNNVLVAGASDGTVRVYNIKSGHCNLRITMDEFHSGSTLIWAIHITSNFTIVTGDSLGNTQFWDGLQGTLIQSFKGHVADVLAVCVNKEENMVFSGGVDSKIVQFRQITNKDGISNWVKAASQRMFSQDIRSLVTLGGNQNLLLSGGLDPSLILYSTKEFGRSSSQKIPPFPHNPLIHLATKAYILMYQMSNGLQFWRLPEAAGQSTTPRNETPTHLLEIKKKGDHHIVCSAVSSCASWAAYSDVYHISLFKLNLKRKGNSQETVTRVLPLPVDLLPARRLVFSPDSSKLLCATSEGSIQLDVEFILGIYSVDKALGKADYQLFTEVGILDFGDLPHLSSTLNIARHNKDSSPVHGLAVSSDFHWLACVDCNNTLNIFSLNKLKLQSTLPQLESPVTAIAFQPQTNYLAAICCNNQVYTFKPSSGKLTDWSIQASEHGLPKQWTERRSKVINIQFNPSFHELMMLQDHSMFTILDLREPLPDKEVILYETGLVQQQKRTMNEVAVQSDQEQTAFKVCRRYGPLLYVGFTEDSALVVVERPWRAMLDKLPPPLYRKKFGM